MKQGSLFCFVLFCLSHWDLPTHVARCHPLGIPSESSWWVGVHWLGLGLFGATVWKLLIIEPFSQWKRSKIETENCIGIWGCFWWCWWKALSQSDLIEFISQFSELRCQRYWFLSGLCCWKFNKLQKLGLGGKISWPLNCQIYKVLILKMWKIKNAFTLRPMA